MLSPTSTEHVRDLADGGVGLDRFQHVGEHVVLAARGLLDFPEGPSVRGGITAPA